jgi:hypothetical protein
MSTAKFRVTVEDLETGDQESKDVAEDDYFVLTTGTCYLAGVQSYPVQGTCVLTIKGHSPKLHATPPPIAEEGR